MATIARREAAERTEREYHEYLLHLRRDTEFYAGRYLKILPKRRALGLVTLEFNPAQAALEEKLREQSEAGKPQRAVVLKARQKGISTLAQAKLIQRSTLLGNHNALVVAHDIDTGGKLYGIGQRMYRNLPAKTSLPDFDGDGEPFEVPLKPEIASYKRSRFLHFGPPGFAAMSEGGWPDSTYWVDTAGEFEAGRGGTYHALHASEYAFWPQPEQKYIALMQAIPEDPDTLVIIESTANGNNHFHTLWDDAVEGRSEFIAFFWAWWQDDEYSKPFVNEAEREEFRIGDTDQSPYAEEEPELVDPGPINMLTGEHVPLTLEQLNWRRWAVANRCGGKIDKFHQEYPATPEQAFLSTGAKVFEPVFVSRAMARALHTDPRVGEGGPLKGMIAAGDHEMRAGRFGPVEVPVAPKWKPARELGFGEAADWRLWLPIDETTGVPQIDPDRRFVIGGDVSEGLPEDEDRDPGGEPAYHAIVVIDHETKEQVAEYRSRCDPDELAEHALMAAEFFNEAWLAIEKTGPGLPVVRRVWLDYRYRFTYFRKQHEAREERDMDRLGWSTDRATKPVLLAGAAELLREETHGIKSRRIVSEMQTYIRLSTGKTLPEKGKFADLFMAWAIAQQVALEKPIRRPKKKPEERPERGRDTRRKRPNRLRSR